MYQGKLRNKSKILVLFQECILCAEQNGSCEMDKNSSTACTFILTLTL